MLSVVNRSTSSDCNDINDFCVLNGVEVLASILEVLKYPV